VSTSGSLEIKLFDPLLHDVDLPLRGTYYPLGFRLNLVTNSREVLQAATESWGCFEPEFEREPVEIRIVVRPEGALVQEQPVFRGQGHLFSISYDCDNFGVYDSRAMCGFAFVSERTAAKHIRLRVHFLEAMAYMLLAQRYGAPVHGACVAREESGVLLCGVSGAGKSTLAFCCARRGWTYVSDDAAWLVRDAEDRMALGKPHQIRFREDAPRLFPELEAYAARTRPNGKLSIEVPLADFPHIRTAPRCAIDRMVILDRRAGTAARLDSIPAEEVIDALMQDGPSYGEEVNAWHEETIRRLLGARAYRLRYDALDEAVETLEITR